MANIVFALDMAHQTLSLSQMQSDSTTSAAMAATANSTTAAVSMGATTPGGASTPSTTANPLTTLTEIGGAVQPIVQRIRELRQILRGLADVARTEAEQEAEMSAVGMEITRLISMLSQVRDRVRRGAPAFEAAVAAATPEEAKMDVDTHGHDHGEIGGHQPKAEEAGGHDKDEEDENGDQDTQMEG